MLQLGTTINLVSALNGASHFIKCSHLMHPNVGNGNMYAIGLNTCVQIQTLHMIWNCSIACVDIMITVN